jgi:hypothetical protein
MVSIFVESDADKALLERLLADLVDRRACRIVARGGRDDARPSARTEMLVAGNPTVLVLNADTTEPDRVALQQRELEWYLAWPGSGVPFEVLAFAPSAEALFFRLPAVLRHVVDVPLNEYIALAGEVAPRKVLERLIAKRGIADYESFLRLLTDEDVCRLRKTREIRTLRRFVEQNAVRGALRKSA